MSVTSVNLSALPFQSSCDSSRLQMASKQVSQSLCHDNCQIPNVISSEYRKLKKTSPMGIYLAPDDGKVIYCNDEIIVLYYYNLDDLETKQLPLIKHATNTFASKLRFSLNTGDEFKKGQTIYSYNEFRDGVPSFGYNIFTGYFPFFGANHEDALVISDYAANLMKADFVERVYIPIYEYSLFQPLYTDENSFTYFPGLGQPIKDDVICSQIMPKYENGVNTSKDLRYKMMTLMKSLNVSDLFNMYSDKSADVLIKSYKSKVTNGQISGVKIHKLRNDATLVDSKLEKTLQTLYDSYITNYVKETVNNLNPHVTQEYVQRIAKENLIYRPDNTINNSEPYKNAVYLLELEISKEEATAIGDKLCNRYAGKGVASIILPDELRPYAEESGKNIDLVFNPFGVFSRMNLSQILESIVSKNVMHTDDKIRENPENTVNELRELKSRVIDYLGDEEYAKAFDNHINKMEKNSDFRQQVLNHIQRNNLYVESPSFSAVDTFNILDNSRVPINETVVIKRETIQYMKQKYNIDMPTINNDVKLSNILCAPVYTMRLNKLASDLITSRDLGPCKFVTKQPLRGRSGGGSSRLGSMEIEGLIAHGAGKTIRELLTVKSDWAEGKNDLIHQLIKNGEYNFPDDFKLEGGTKKVVNTLVEFLQD